MGPEEGLLVGLFVGRDVGWLVGCKVMRTLDGAFVAGCCEKGGYVQGLNCEKQMILANFQIHTPTKKSENLTGVSKALASAVVHLT